jgi:3-hydroxybutyryl-CoA dehydrogenase
VSVFPRVAVLGAGTMGHGIAQVAAAAGSTVALYDVDPAAPGRALERVRLNLEKGVSLGKVSAEARDATITRLLASSNLADAVGSADLVVEAAPESMPLKRALLAEVERMVPASAVLATNTSSLSIAELAAVLHEPGRFLGLHFFNPVHVMALVEVVWGPLTDRDVLESAVVFVNELGKEPVVVKDSPGFASSRLGVLIGLEAMRMVEEGVSTAEGIDRAMELGYRHPMGPLRLTDLVGLDVRLGIAEYLHQELGSEAFRPPEILRRMVAQGKLGKKSGEGFYHWEDRG